MLPKIAIPTFTVTLPISKKKLTCRPYLVKEDKILLMAAQNISDQSNIARATRDVINACVMENNFDVANYCAIDADFLLMNLRAKSVNDKVELEITCNENSCGHKFNASVAIADLKLVDSFPDRKDKIMLSGDVGVKMKPMSFEVMLEDASKRQNLIDTNIDIIFHSIDCIFDKDKIWTPKEFTKEEFVEWIEGLSGKNMEQMVRYIEQSPKLVLEKEAKCPKCGYNHLLKYEDPISFF